MKKIISLILVAVMLISCMLVLSACGNKMLFDTTYKFKYAYVIGPDGTSECIEISGWKDYDGEQLQIKDTDGNVYLFSSYNCILTTEKK